jgi:hypothetical protein
MPIYTLRKVSTGEEWDVNCTFHELAPMLEDDDILKVITPPKIISGTGGVLSKTDDGWKEQLGRIHKGAGKNSNIKL